MQILLVRGHGHLGGRVAGAHQAQLAAKRGHVEGRHQVLILADDVEARAPLVAQDVHQLAGNIVDSVRAD